MKEGLLKNFFLQNITLKIIALSFAVVLWFLVVGEKQAEISFWIPLEFKNLPKDMIMIGEPVREAEITILGAKKVLKGLSPDQLIAIIDLVNLKQGVNNLRITHNDIKIPKGIDIINIRPSSIVIHVETARHNPETEGRGL
ncbi:MAG: hypothetical protein HY026_03910 [Deltaproteobacteria bacterium]|nr:hypothetical protein [Deltaproteobacteria bacterium]